MNRNDKFELFFSENELISSNKSWKKIGDNYEQYSINSSRNYITNASCGINSKLLLSGKTFSNKIN